MKDPVKMTKTEKYNYIFAPDPSRNNEIRFDWISHCLLGDIQTFLDGVENFTQNKRKFSDNLPRGGGNLSVPILISTALEFVAALYMGKTNYILCFSEDISEELREEWNQLKIENLTNRLREMIKSKGLKINERATIASISKNRIEIDKYQIKKEAGKLNVYENYNATDNVGRFIEYFFPKEYKNIPFLLWDGVRNGLVHTFSPKPFKYHQNYIRFQFFVEDRKVQAHVTKVDNTILIRINIFELYQLLKKAIEDYRAELENNENLQDKFILAWASIEEYTRNIDHDVEKSNEAKRLLSELKKSNNYPLLQ